MGHTGMGVSSSALRPIRSSPPSLPAHRASSPCSSRKRNLNSLFADAESRPARSRPSNASRRHARTTRTHTRRRVTDEQRSLDLARPVATRRASSTNQKKAKAAKASEEKRRAAGEDQRTERTEGERARSYVWTHPLQFSRLLLFHLSARAPGLARPNFNEVLTGQNRLQPASRRSRHFSSQRASVGTASARTGERPSWVGRTGFDCPWLPPGPL